MKSRPILFSAPMVRALLDGTKTQTRRALKVQPSENMPGFTGLAHHVSGSVWRSGKPWLSLCPYGKSGELLWVRETWSQPTSLDPGPTFYFADYPACVPNEFENVPAREAIKWKPSIHMRRELSRITLRITDVRVERLQDISEADAMAEGCERLDSEREEHDWKLCPRCGGTGLYEYIGGNGGVMPDTDCTLCDTYVKRYRHLWESINGASSWDANPWVWVVVFEKVTAATDDGASL